MIHRVLLVGATSPIGAAIEATLVHRGWDVIGTSRRPSANRSLDVTDEQDVRAVVSAVRPSSVVYLASPETADDAGAAVAAAAVLRFRDVVAEAGARSLIFASSAAVYGTGNRSPRRETDALLPENAYARGKVAAESALRGTVVDDEFRVLSLRIFNVYGPRLTSSLINRMFAGDGTEPEVYATAEFVRDYVHVSDVAEAFADAIAGDSPGYADVNVGTGVGTDNLSLLDRATASADPREVAPDFSSHSVANTDRIRAVLGRSPRIRLDDALRDPSAFLT